MTVTVNVTTLTALGHRGVVGGLGHDDLRQHVGEQHRCVVVVGGGVALVVDAGDAGEVVVRSHRPGR